MYRIKNTLILISLLLLFSGCENKTDINTNTYYDMTPEVANAPDIYVDFEKFKEGRPCSEVKFICLPESQDKSWQIIPTKDYIEDLEITQDIEKKFNKIVKEWHIKHDEYHNKKHPKGENKPMLITSVDRDFFDKVEKRRFLDEMVESLEKEFPGFWKSVPNKVRYRWLRRAMSKSEKFGYESKKPGAMIELCARIGLDFDLDPKWKNITQFISYHKLNIGPACDYIDFTVFEKDYSPNGDKYTDWYLKEALGYLPKPKRPLPKLNEI